MNKRNKTLANSINSLTVNSNLVEANNIPNPDTTNISGQDAYELEHWKKLIAMLNTLKVESQFYRNEKEILQEVITLLDICAKEDLLLTAKTIAYSRNMCSGMRTINNFASAYIARYLSNVPWAKAFYGKYNKKYKIGGVVYRADDMHEIIFFYRELNPKKSLPSAMKKAFRNAIETYDSYLLLKYKKEMIDVINMVHPNPNNSSTVEVETNGEVQVVPTITAIMKGMSVSADTWEVANSEAGQIVATAVKEGKLDKEEAKEVLKNAKGENFKSLLEENKLGILAALRNIRNILLNNPESSTIDKLCNLLKDTTSIINGKIMPYQYDYAHTIIENEFNDANARKVLSALNKGFQESIPNLSEIFKGRNLVILDCSGSMTSEINFDNKSKKVKNNAIEKASLLASALTLGTNADLIRFGSGAEYYSYNPNVDVFTLSKDISKTNMGGTNISIAMDLAKSRKYDRIFLFSDNEINAGSQIDSLRSYVRKHGMPYMYLFDMCAYGSVPFKGDNVRYFAGYYATIFDDVISTEFKGEDHIDKIKNYQFVSENNNLELQTV